MSASTEMFSLHTRLQSLPFAEVEVALTGDKEQDKKQARKKISLQNTSQKVGFLHAVLIGVRSEYFLLAGPSGIGKTTYAEYLNQMTNGDITIEASDWVAVERDNDAFYASDLNFKESLRHKNRRKISGIIFLTKHDEYNRDAFYPNSFEYKNVLKETFDTASKQELAVLRLFWQYNKLKLPFLCVLPARLHDEEYVATTLYDLCFTRTVTQKNIEVGVIGLGALGSKLAFQLGQLPFVSKVHLYNRNPKKAIGYATDMNQALLGKNGEDVFVAHDDPEAVFKLSHSVFLSFRDETDMSLAPKNIPERWGKFYAHLPIVKRYAHLASKAKYKGSIFMLSNPVDILAYAFYAYSQKEANPLRSYQIWGIGLELDVARALNFGKKTHKTLRPNDIRIYGSHADKLILQTPLSPAETAKINTFIKATSGDIRQYIPRTVYGPVGATIKTFTSYIKGKSIHLTTVRGGSFIGEKIRFLHGLPQIPLDADHLVSSRLLEENRDVIAQYLDV